MRRSFLSIPKLVLTVAGAALLCGCGGGTKTVSVASAPPAAQTGTTTAPQTSTASTTTSPATTPASTAPPAGSKNGGTSGPTTTRTAPEPAFTQQGAGAGTGTTAEGLSGAEAVLQARGYTANVASDYHPNQTLRVLVGTRPGSGQQAFFFVGGHYIGNDAKQPSASIHVVSQGETEVTLAYSLADSSGAGAGHATVRFQLNNGKLTPLDPIPPASSNSGPSRG
ncbi:MAG TPA: LppP/LprE family lipoprotein [Solirubrobacteraceae bacterium]|nr:LppP/LprE family lipoprotein [Solirubrobacteraceae bacterium]